MFNINEKRQQLRNLGKRASEDLAPKGKEITPEAIGQAIAAQLAPALDSIHRAIASINIQFPDLKLPAPIVNVAPAQVHIPETKFPEQMHTQSTLAGVDKDRPLPVIMMDQAGKPFVFNFGATGGKSDFFTIKDIRSSTASLIDQTENALRVTGSFALSLDYGSGVVASQTPRFVHATDVGVSVNVIGAGVTIGVVTINPDGTPVYGGGSGGGLTDAELRATSVPVSQVSGASDSVVVNEIFGSTGANVINPDGRIKVELPSGASGLTDTELRASHLDTQQLSGTIDSVYATGAAASFFAEILNPDGRVKVEMPAGSSGLTDAELRATAVPVSQVSGANWSVNVVSGGGAGTQYTKTTVYDEPPTGTVIGYIEDTTYVSAGPNDPFPIWDQYLNAALENGAGVAGDVLRVRQVSGAADSVNVVTTVGLTDTELRATGVPVSQVSGANWSVSVTNTLDVQVIDTIGLTDSQLRASHLDVEQLSGSNWSVYITGALDSMMTYEARQTNPTAKSDGADVRPKTDDLGRILTRPIQVRDLITTARVAKTSGSTFGTETTLLAASAGVYKDLIYVLATNDSTAAITCDFRSVTAGNVLFTLRIPANGSTGMALPVPIPQDATGNNWTIDLDDVTGTNVTVSALFTTEI